MFDLAHDFCRLSPIQQPFSHVALAMLGHPSHHHSRGACHRHGALLVHLQEGRLLALALAAEHRFRFGNLILLYVLAFSDWKVVPAPQAYWRSRPCPPTSAFPPQP